MARNFKSSDFSSHETPEAVITAELANVLVRVPLFEMAQLKKIASSFAGMRDSDITTITRQAMESVLRHTENRIQFEFQEAKRRMERLGLTDDE